MAYRKGFSLIEAIVIVVVLGLIGLVGVKAWDAFRANDTTSVNRGADSAAAPTISTPSDLDKAAKFLDETDIDGQESATLDQQTDF